MMKQLAKSVALVMAALALTGSVVRADENSVRQALLKAMPSAVNATIQPSEVQGLYQVVIGANLFYMSGDGKYLLQGRLVDLQEKKDLTEAKLAGVRKKALESLGPEQMIVYKPEHSQYKVYIFTDIDCGYCRKLHSQLDQYLAEGITIQYLFFPRAGKGSESYKKAVSVWCADDRNAALTAAKKDNPPEEKTCPNPVDTHMQLGADFGARGTPMIVTENGTIYPGYLPPKQLLEVLKEDQK